MPIRDVEAMNASLDNDYGTTRGPNAADSHELALFYGDPMTDGVEISGGGYARVTVNPADWLPANDGFKSTEPIQFPATSGAWPDSPTHFALYDGSVMWDNAPLVEPLDVTAASATGPTVVVTVFYDDNVLAPETV